MRSTILTFTTLVGLVIGPALLTGCGASTPKLAPQIRLAGEDTPTNKAESPLTAGRGQVARLEPNRFEASCPDFPQSGVAQRTPVWCWAACAEMVHSYRGTPMSQHEIAERIHGRFEPEMTKEQREEVAQAAGYEEIIRALVPEAEIPEVRGAARYLGLKLTGGGASFNISGVAESQAKRNLANSDILLDDLLSGEPVVVGLRNFDSVAALEAARQAAVNEGRDASGITFGHVYVVHSAEFSRAKKSIWGGLKEGIGNVGDFVGDVFTDENGNPTTSSGAIPLADEFKDAEDWGKRIPTKYDLWSVRAIDPMPRDGQLKDELIDALSFANRVAFMISAREAREIIESQSYLKDERVGDR